MKLFKWRKDHSYFTNLVKCHFGRICVSKTEDILVNIFAVELEIKPAFLFDYGRADVGNVAAFCEKLREGGLISIDVYVTNIAADVFVLKRRRSTEDYTSVTSSRPTFVDVTGTLRTPMIMSRETIDTKIWLTMKFFNSYSNYTDVDVLSTHRHSDEADVNITSLFGLLLGYPVVYWYDDRESDLNCLSMQPLVMFRVFIRCTAKPDDRQKCGVTDKIDELSFSRSYRAEKSTTSVSEPPQCLNGTSNVASKGETSHHSSNVVGCDLHSNTSDEHAIDDRIYSCHDSRMMIRHERTAGERINESVCPTDPDITNAILSVMTEFATDEQPIYSFSIPLALLESVQLAIDDWLKDLRSKCTFAFEVRHERRLETHPCLAL